MKTFILSIYKNSILKLQKEVLVANQEELDQAKNIFLFESPYKKRNGIYLTTKQKK